jgi:molybdopterin synthase sulfur carrier subunit
MKVKVKGYLTYREVIGEQQLQFEEGEIVTVYDLLTELVKESDDDFREMIFDPDSGQVSLLVAILVNGRHYSHLPDRLETVLSDQDEVAIFPPIAGG